MFNRISLRLSDADDAVISTEVRMARKGAASRIVFAFIVSIGSLFWLAPFFAVLYLSAALVWEVALRSRVTAWAVARFEGRRDRLRVFYHSIILVVASFYSIIPLTGVMSHERIGWYLAMTSFATAIIAGVTYFSNDKWQFAACTSPSFLVATAAPFVFGVPVPMAAIMLV